MVFVAVLLQILALKGSIGVFRELPIPSSIQ